MAGETPLFTARIDTTIGGMKTELGNPEWRVVVPIYSTRYLCVWTRPDGILSIRLATHELVWTPDSDQMVVLPNQTRIRVLDEEELRSFFKAQRQRVLPLLEQFPALQELTGIHL